jgi:hypothetical protein
MIYKVQIQTDSEDAPFKDFYVKVESITGFYIPEEEDDLEHCINIIHDGLLSSIKQEKHITDYLYEKFIKTCIENK